MVRLKNFCPDIINEKLYIELEKIGIKTVEKFLDLSFEKINEKSLILSKEVKNFYIFMIMKI